MMKPQFPSLLIAPTLLAAILVLAGPGASARATAADDHNGNFASRMLEATFKFFHPNSTSTCFLVADHDDPAGDGEPAIYLVSSGHTFERTRGETAVLVLRQPDGNGSYQRHDHTIHIREGEHPLWIQHESEDIGVLRLDGPLPVEVNPLPLAAIADESAIRDARLQIGGQLLVLTYPHRVEAHPSGLPVARLGIFASPPQLPVSDRPTFLADFTTFSGDSGGPAFVAVDDHTPLVVGVVIAEMNHNTTMRNVYEERRIRHPLNLGQVLHATFVRDTIKAAREAQATTNEDAEQAPAETPDAEPAPDDQPGDDPGETPPEDADGQAEPAMPEPAPPANGGQEPEQAPAPADPDA